MRHHWRRAFTLVELLVVMAIIAIMVSATLPAINAMRGAARRTQCMANVSRLITAVHNYEMAYEVYPAGVENDSGPIYNQPQGFHHGWMQALLPYLDEQAVAARIDREVGVYAEQNREVRAVRILTFVCPSAPDDGQFPGLSCYAGVQHDVEAPINKDKVLSRTDDMVSVKGIHFYPQQIQGLLEQVEGVHPRFQLVIRHEGEKDVIEVLVEVSEQIFFDDMRRQRSMVESIQKNIQEELELMVKVRLVEARSLRAVEGRVPKIVDERPK